MNNSLNIEMNLEIGETINKLEKIKSLLKDIKEIDNNFIFSNVIETEEDTILIFNCEHLYKKEHIQAMERMLENQLKCKCIILRDGLSLDKAIKADVDYSKRKRLYNNNLLQ